MTEHILCPYCHSETDGQNISTIVETVLFKSFCKQKDHHFQYFRQGSHYYDLVCGKWKIGKLFRGYLFDSKPEYKLINTQINKSLIIPPFEYQDMAKLLNKYLKLKIFL